jgi:hypothetical protein
VEVGFDAVPVGPFEGPGPARRGASARCGVQRGLPPSVLPQPSLGVSTGPAYRIGAASRRPDHLQRPQDEIRPTP